MDFVSTGHITQCTVQCSKYSAVYRPWFSARRTVVYCTARVLCNVQSLVQSVQVVFKICTFQYNFRKRSIQRKTEHCLLDILFNLIFQMKFISDNVAT